MLLGAFRIALLLVFLPSALQMETPLPGTFLNCPKLYGQHKNTP